MAYRHSRNFGRLLPSQPTPCRVELADAAPDSHRSRTVGSVGFMFNLSSAAAEPPAAGPIAPAFTLPSQDGSAVSLVEFRGKWVLLYFYPKDNTPGCTIEAHNFQRDLPKYESLNTVVLGVSLD